MAFEIERKFLLRGDSWRAHVTARKEIRDGLVSRHGGAKVRVRIADGRATIAIKSARIGIGRHEYEYAIPLAEAEDMLANVCQGRVLEKRRYLVPHGGLTWEVDVYRGLLAGIVLAEIEIPSLAAPLDLPSWIGEEVTGNPAYGKLALLEQRLAAAAEAKAGSAALSIG